MHDKAQRPTLSHSLSPNLLLYEYANYGMQIYHVAMDFSDIVVKALDFLATGHEFDSCSDQAALLVYCK